MNRNTSYEFPHREDGQSFSYRQCLEEPKFQYDGVTCDTGKERALKDRLVISQEWKFSMQQMKTDVTLGSSSHIGSKAAFQIAH